MLKIMGKLLGVRSVECSEMKALYNITADILAALPKFLLKSLALKSHLLAFNPTSSAC